ncbi:MAG: efflux RND transporter periplasmic adaptor subunit [Deltaproteobacteria bacterium]
MSEVVASSKPAFTTETRDVLRVAGPPRAKGRRWRWLALALVGTALTVGAWIGVERARAPKPPSFVTVPLAKGDLTQTVTAVGTLAPVDSVDLGTVVTGRLIRVLVDVNDHVKVGQVMAEIDPEQLEAQVRQGQAQLESARANQLSAHVTLNETKLKAERANELNAQGVASGDEKDTAQAALQRAEAAVGVANAQITVAQASLTTAKTMLSHAVIKAPIEGIVLSRAIEPGQTVTAGFQTPVLFTLARDLGKLELSVEVDEADIAKVQEGQPASFTVDAYPGRTFPSKVLLLHNLPKAGATVVTYTALLSVDNGDRSLRPGMTATAAVVTDRLSDVWLVDNAALRFEPPRPAAQRRGGFLPLPGFGGPGGGRRPGAATGAAGTPGSAPAAAGDRIFLADGTGTPRRVPVQVLATDGAKSAVAPRAGGARGEGAHAGQRRPDGPNRPAAAGSGEPPAPPPVLAEGASVIVDVAVEPTS